MLALYISGTVVQSFYNDMQCIISLRLARYGLDAIVRSGECTCTTDVSRRRPRRRGGLACLVNARFVTQARRSLRVPAVCADRRLPFG